MVSMTIVASGWAATSRRDASTPPMPGIRTSMRTRSGRSIGNRARTSSPLPAAVTRSTPGTALTTRRTASRARGASSHTRTVVMTLGVLPIGAHHPEEWRLTRRCSAPRSPDFSLSGESLLFRLQAPALTRRRVAAASRRGCSGPAGPRPRYRPSASPRPEVRRNPPGLVFDQWAVTPRSRALLWRQQRTTGHHALT